MDFLWEAGHYRNDLTSCCCSKMHPLYTNSNLFVAKRICGTNQKNVQYHRRRLTVTTSLAVLLHQAAVSSGLLLQKIILNQSHKRVSIMVQKKYCFSSLSWDLPKALNKKNTQQRVKSNPKKRPPVPVSSDVFFSDSICIW